MERKYSLDEIDHMRSHIGNLCDTGSSYNGAERNAQVEDRLRTYMQAGVDPKDIEEKSRQKTLTIDSFYQSLITTPPLPTPPETAP